MERKRLSHPAADALDWEEAISVIDRLNEDGKYRDALLICVGCNLGLRISDILQLKWYQLLDSDILQITEKKTSKGRSLKINNYLHSQALLAYEELCIEDKNRFIFVAWNTYGGEHPFSRVRAHQILKEVQYEYHISSAKVFSTHSLRKTFGRRVWLTENKKGRGDQALLLLCDVFGHSSTAITKRYLGIRQQEILSLYDNII